MATIDPRVDVLGQVEIMWRGPRAVGVIESDFGLMYTSNLTISDVGREDDGTGYRCSVRVVGVLGTTVTKFTIIRVIGENYLHILVEFVMKTFINKPFLSLQIPIHWSPCLPIHLTY